MEHQPAVDFGSILSLSPSEVDPILHLVFHGISWHFMAILPSLEMAPTGTTRSSSSFSARREAPAATTATTATTDMTDMATAEAKHLDRKHVVFGEIVREDGQVGRCWDYPLVN